jgi:hypothetical protein
MRLKIVFFTLKIYNTEIVENSKVVGLAPVLTLISVCQQTNNKTKLGLCLTCFGCYLVKGLAEHTSVYDTSYATKNNIEQA